MAFRHHASAAAFGGYMTAPFTEALTTQAASVLSPVGGYGSARVENYRYHQIVSFDVGYSQVIGTRRLDRKGNTVHETLSQAVVEGLNILDIVTADRVVSRLASEYVESEPPDEYRFRPIGSYFVNLRIAGCRIGDASGHQLDHRRQSRRQRHADRPAGREVPARTPLQLAWQGNPA
jgi:hypothetical protein